MKTPFTLSQLESMQTGDRISTPVQYLRIKKTDNWFIVENVLLHTQQFYNNYEDVFHLVHIERLAS